MIAKFDDGKTVLGGQRLKSRFSPNRQSVNRSNSPKPAMRHSYNKLGTPNTVTYIASKVLERKISPGLTGSPKASRSPPRKSVAMTTEFLGSTNSTTPILNYANSFNGKSPNRILGNYSSAGGNYGTETSSLP